MALDINTGVISALVFSVLAIVGVLIVGILVRFNLISDNSNSVQLGNTFQSVIAATTEAIDINGKIGDVDGIRVFPGERILVRVQLRPEQNGLYLILADMTLKRADDLTDTDQVIEGNTVYVIRGVTQQGATYVLQRPRLLTQTEEASIAHGTVAPDQTVAVGHHFLQTAPLAEDPIEMTFTIVSDVYLGNAIANTVLIKDPSQPTSTSFTSNVALNTLTVKSLTAGTLTYPETDGNNGDRLVTNGAGHLSFQPAASETGNVLGQLPVQQRQIPVYNSNTENLLSASLAQISTNGSIFTPSGLTVGNVNVGTAEGLSLLPFSTAVGSTREARFYELSISGSEYVGLKAPDAVNASVVFALPSTDGAAGDIMQTDGNGQLSFVAPGSGGNVSGQGPSQVNGIPTYQDTTGQLLGPAGASLTTTGRLQVNDYVSSGTVNSGSAIGVELNPYGTLSGNTRELRFKELNTNGSNYVGFRAPDLITSDIIWTLPSTDGIFNSGLITDGAGNLSFTSLANVSGETPTATGNLVTYVDTTGQLIRAGGASCTINGDMSVVNSLTVGVGGDGTITAGATNQGVASGLVMQPFNTLMGSTKELQFKELTTNGSNHVGFKAPDLIVNDTIWTLPAVNGNVGETLQIQSGSSLSWKLPEAYRVVESESLGVNSTSPIVINTWNIRVLNLIHNDSPFTNVMLSSNQVTLPAGTWDVEIAVPGVNVGSLQARWRNVTDGTTDLTGSSALSQDTSTGDVRVTVWSRARRVLSITAPKVFQLEYWLEQNNGTDSSTGIAVGATGSTEEYASVFLRKLTG